MKKLLKLIICSAVIMAVSSCDFFEENNYPDSDFKKQSSIDGLTPEIKEHFVAQDAFMKDLVNKLDTLAAALNRTQEENSLLKGKIETIKSSRTTWAWMAIGAIVLSLITLLLTLFRRGLNEHEVRAVVNDRLDGSQRIKNLMYNVHDLIIDVQRYSQNTQSVLSSSHNMDMRLRQVEKKLEEIVNCINGQQLNGQVQTPIQRQETRKSNQTEIQHRVGYARIDSEHYFTTIYDSNQEGCAFKITFKNDSQGEYTIISLDRISSSNDWQQKIECSGVSVKDASDYRIEELGVCKNIGNNTWEVTKPLKIRLLK